MFGACTIRNNIIGALGMLLILWGGAGAAAPPEAADVLEVKVLDAQVSPGQAGVSDVIYHMEVISVVQSAAKVEPGETVTVRTSGMTAQSLEPGWTGTAYLNPDPNASGPDAGRQFVTALPGASLVKLPPGPPSATFTKEVPAGGQ